MMRALAALLLLLPFGDEKKIVDAVCPLDGHKFQTWEVVSRDYTLAWGGLDRDFCYHAFKTTPLEYFAWTCPSCGFSGMKEDFAVETKPGETTGPKHALTDEAKAKILGKLTPAVPVRKGMKPDAIAGHAKYDLIAQAAVLRDAPPEAAALGWLRAAWCARQQGTVWLDAFDEWIDLRRDQGLEVMPMDLGKKNRAELELEIARRIEKAVAERREMETRDVAAVKDCDTKIAALKKDAKANADAIKAEEKRRGDARGRCHYTNLLKYTALWCWRKHGENVEAKKWLDELAKAKGDNSVIDDAVEATAKSIELEQAYQKKALEQYEKALAAGKLEKRVEAEVTYLVGELHRRLGDKAKAAERYKKAAELTADPNIKKWAQEQLKLVE